jgi:hypothetical protein
LAAAAFRRTLPVPDVCRCSVPFQRAQNLKTNQKRTTRGLLFVTPILIEDKQYKVIVQHKIISCVDL